MSTEVVAAPHGKQFTLYTHDTGPNGWKVAIVLEELGLTYESIYLVLEAGDHKAPAYTKYNPNGRVPTLIDHHNGDFIIWESNAILTYLVDTYDTEHKISAENSKDRYTQLQWLFFQASGQGPYYGQAIWFLRLHPERVPSAVERYQKEIIRVLGVLESVLSKQEWLVGDKCTIADISFVTWNNIVYTPVMQSYKDFSIEKDFPAVAAWHQKIRDRDAVKKALAVRESFQKK